ncbi:MAG: sugar-binding domain-containing protein [Pelolinea sp.]|nr:sugar-binding domain-containing protein [Pelolinea sp.]
MQFEESRETYAKIATLYYIAEKSQNEIAQIFHISRFKVSRILKRCRTLKIIEFHINIYSDYYAKLEQQIKDLLIIEQAIIVPSSVSPQESKENVAKMAANYLQGKITDGSNIGLSWGSTIQLILKFFHPHTQVHNAQFVQLSGNVCSNSISQEGYLDGSYLVQEFASRMQAGWSAFQVPYIVQTPILKELLYQEPQIVEHVSLFSKLDIAIIGIGSSNPERSVSYLSGYLSLEETTKLVEDGMGADICGTRLMADGQFRDTILTDRVITVDLKDLKNLSEVCAVGAGGEKALSFIAGCKGGYIKKVIMDELCALSIIRKLED